MKRRNKIRRMRGVENMFFSNQKALLLLGLLLLIILIALYLIFFTNIFRKGDTLTALGITENTDICTADGTLIYYLEGSTLYCINSSGDVIWTSKYSSGKMNLQVGNQIICLYNEDTATVLDCNKIPLFNIPASDFKINQVVCGKNTIAMLCSMPENNKKYLRIFDAAGTELDRIEITTTSFLDFGFFGESDNFWYMTLDTSGAEPISRITTTMPTQQKITGLYEIYGQLVSDVEFLNSNVYVSTTSSLIAYDTFGEIFYEQMIYGSNLADSLIVKDDLVLAFVSQSDIAGTFSTLRLLSANSLDTLVLLPSGIKYVALSEKYVYAFSDNVIYLYDYNGEFVKSIQLDFTLSSFEKIYDKLTLLRSEDTTYLFSLS